MAPRPKFYVVWRGRKPGIYTDWAACEAQVKGYAGAEYKAFPTREIAEQAYQQRFMSRRRRPPERLWDYSLHPPVTGSIAVDAACSGNPGRVEWRGVHTASGREFFRKGPYPDGTNNVGEFLAIVHALSWLHQQGNQAPVYSDSRTAIAWVKAGKCKTSLQHTRRNAVLFELIAGAEAWLAANRYANPVLKWNTADWGEIPADFDRK